MDAAAAIDLASQAFGLVGVIVTVYAGVVAAVQLALRELGRSTHHYREIRVMFTNRILFGLEFFIVSDLIRTFTDPALEELFRLGVIVAIRVVLAYFLEREAKEFPDIG
jgi:uncharacterized membrane protein